MQNTAIYQPTENKLRIYPAERLDAETYAKVKLCGYRWAPKQGVFFASWTPRAEDVAIELCGCINDEDMTPDERAAERAERFEGYSASRAKDADAAYNSVKRISDCIPFGQPILVGHHSEGRHRADIKRIENGMRNAVKNWDTADYWERRAKASMLHAQRMESPVTRSNRIKKIKADMNLKIRIREKAEIMLAYWEKKGEEITREQALAVATHCDIHACFLLTEYPRDESKSQYEGLQSLWSAISGDIASPKQARALAIKHYSATIPYAQRWITHYENRLAYETAMLSKND